MRKFKFWETNIRHVQAVAFSDIKMICRLSRPAGPVSSFNVARPAEYEGTVDEGCQSEYSLKVDKIGLNSDSDYVIVADEFNIKIYKPIDEHRVSNLVLEARLNAYVIQIETGKFITGSEERQVIVLHPNSYSIYSLQTKEAEIEAEPGARLLLMVASEDSKLYIYENTLLLWSCDLNHIPIAINRCFLKGLPGGVVTLSTTGILSINFLGTEPDLSTNNVVMLNEPMDSEKIQEELSSVEESLKKILDCENDSEKGTVHDLLKFKIDIGKPTQNLYLEPTENDEETLHLDELAILHKQFTLIQKKLLVQYGSLPPGDCESLEFLMKDTYNKLTTTVKEIVESKDALNRAGNRLQAIGRLIILLMEVNDLDQFKLKLLKDMLSLDSFYEDYQEWEEAIAQSISYIHNNIFKKSEKDREKLAPLTEQGILSHVNFKRLLKQIKLILDQMFSEVLISNKDETVETPGDKNIMRIEELVEVI
ncbi:Protein PTHB1 [Eumeta japonica]|uniref:Protein PTHB1 n=1 Tax=Eumeta variegata TaxID=151549 RepID=A0A4C1WUM0_EUMVA|nr:Protein PTHB1 [Eumeta japonica]